ncbi:MAG: B12-binding domain-containing radical SAM protein [Caldisphaera sp.]|jgi:radical SAM superfamily enzyme YgiQ (UPF0313 family)|nr:radical SAM protein [Caldisphaera sp.]PMP60876.1 MAG: radical SAM protein [Caldisphaera sp.]PMP89261.1 MAG: radical SAM protein [Caldisphaera sp.]
MKNQTIIEKGLVKKKFRKGMKKIALFYPSNYNIAMSSLIYHRIYFLLNDIDDIYVERFFIDIRDENTGRLRSLENRMNLENFDYIIVPIHYELDYVNIIKALMSSNIEIYSIRREKPKIILGGPTVTANPEPLGDLSDIEIIGDLEAVWDDLIDIIRNDSIEPKRGIYVPKLGKIETEEAIAKSIFKSDYRRILSKEAKFTLAVEAMRGCPFNCLFCMESYITKPVRYKEYDDIIKEINELNSRYGEKITLMGLTLNSHPRFKEILKYSIENKIDISLPSLRAELLDEDSIKMISKLRQLTLTIAPESSERIRNALGKNISNDDIINVARYAKKYNMNLKLYLMVSIPGENKEDLKEMVELTKEIKKIGVKKIHLSVNPLVIKPRTPLQWLPMNSEKNMKEKIKYIRENALYDDITIYDPFYALIQGGISLSDRNVLKHLIDVSIGQGKPSWRRALNNGLAENAIREKHEPFPWSHIKGFIEEAIMKKILEAFLNRIS